MHTELPQNLAHYSSAIARIEMFDPESLGDDNPEALDVVETAIRSRIRGMSEEQAEATLEEDCATFQRWLEQPDRADSAAHYVGAVLFGLSMSPDLSELLS
jgi:hypothetical protein